MASAATAIETPGVNPRYAAFAASLGHDATPEGVRELQRNVGNVPFLSFMSRCRQSAPASMFTPSGTVADQDAWTRHIWSVATSDLLGAAA